MNLKLSFTSQVVILVLALGCILGGAEISGFEGTFLVIVGIAAAAVTMLIPSAPLDDDDDFMSP